MGPVQPRVCGEQLSQTDVLGTGRGSAPRVRGTDCQKPRDSAACRFSPACAGNRNESGPAFWRAGFSPACAGNSPDYGAMSLCVTVQPRVCGEQDRQAHVSPACGGSAPRVRGTVPARCPAWGYTRFSPACAGNRGSTPGSFRSMSVQPRVCGEQCAARSASACRLGSAPRVRGTEQFQQRDGRKSRFSPACAGNRATSSRNATASAVQPRVCGEQTCLQHLGCTALFTCQRAVPK